MTGGTAVVDVVVIGAGQAGLSAAYFLAHRGFARHDDFVVLDSNRRSGGAWQHRWSTLTMNEVHGVHDLPGLELGEPDPRATAGEVITDYFSRYEATFDLPVIRPAKVEAVRESAEGRLEVVADTGTLRTRGLINATGTWTRPYWPAYPDAEAFTGRQLHTADYPGPDEFAGQHVVVVGGGHSAVQHLAELSEVATTTWVTRRPPDWRTHEFDLEARREAVAEVAEAVEAGRRPPSVVSVTGLVATGPVEEARRRGVYERLPMFARITPDGVAWDDARHIDADVILWATGFRHALNHLAPLGLRSQDGGISMEHTHVAGDPRIHLLGYGPSASTIGANRAARLAVRDLRRYLDQPGHDSARPSAQHPVDAPEQGVTAAVSGW